MVHEVPPNPSTVTRMTDKDCSTQSRQKNKEWFSRLSHGDLDRQRNQPWYQRHQRIGTKLRNCQLTGHQHLLANCCSHPSSAPGLVPCETYFFSCVAETKARSHMVPSKDCIPIMFSLSFLVSRCMVHCI